MVVSTPRICFLPVAFLLGFNSISIIKTNSLSISLLRFVPFHKVERKAASDCGAGSEGGVPRVG
jgi:hypothetical protein